MSYQRFVAAGNCGAEPEIRHMPDGTAVANISLATTERWTKDGEKKEKTSWHRLVFFGPMVEKVIVPYVKKGSQILVEGTIDYQEWTDKESGDKKYATNIKCSALKLMGGRSDNAGGQPQQQAPQAQAQPQRAEPVGGGFDEDSEIPF